MQRPAPTYCPLVQGACKQFDCLWWTQLRGTHPQTGQEIDEYDCAVRWLPILLIENAKESRQTAAAVESFRNHVARQQTVFERVTARQPDTRTFDALEDKGESYAHLDRHPG